ncbi:unnamed protein product [Calypogeia fissa]
MVWLPWRRGGGRKEQAKQLETRDSAAQKEAEAAAPTWEERLEQYNYEEMYKPDPRYDSDIEEELTRSEFFKKRQAETPEEIEQNKKEIEQFKNSPMVQFLIRAEELNESELAKERLRNNQPTRKEDAKFWKSLPHVPGPYGGPALPRMALNSETEIQARFWDFFKQFGFGLWGYKQRPYPISKPCDVQQVLGYKWLDKRYADYAMRAGGWYYKDRLGRTRGPMEMVNLKTAWAAGIVDKNTFIWGDDMDEWAPIGMIYGLQTAIETPDIKAATMGTSLVQKMVSGVPLWHPRKGHEFKSYRQLQAEAIEKRERENAVLRKNKGAWPGERAPSYSLFLWASGPELTTILDGDDKGGKFIPYNVRKKLARDIPGLRPWEVRDVEQVMDLMTFNRQWYREDLGDFTTKPDYEKDWFETFQEKWDEIAEDIEAVFGRGDDAEIDSKAAN